MLYTRKGDAGTSGLFGTKERLPKDSLVYEALGTLDELNSLLGVVRARAARGEHRAGVAGELLRAQERLFVIQAELAGADKTLSRAHVEELERAIDALEEQAGNPHSFVIPGATEFSALLDHARAVCRRAERTSIRASHDRALSAASAAYLNRLSSLLYALARYAATLEEVKESSPRYQSA